MARQYRKRRSGFGNLRCENCGQVFHPRPRTDRVIRFCGRDCFQASRNHPKEKQCPQCGDMFTPERHIYGSPPIHCSRRCDNKSRITKQGHICKTCRQKFWRVKSRSPLYCSHRCQGKSLEKNVPKVCEWCGQIFNCKPFSASNRRFCSRECIRSKVGESRPERLVREALEDLQIQFQQEYKVLRYHLDFFWPEHNLAIEADGGFWHTNSIGRLRDQRRDTNLLALGIKTIRITEDDLNKAFDVTALLRNRLSSYLEVTS